MNALDTHRLVKRLVAVGFSDEQAETVTDVVRESREFDLSNLATKADLAQLLAATKADFVQLLAATKADFVQLRSETKADFAQLQTATKADLAQLRSETKADLAQLQAATKADLGQLRRETTAEFALLRTEMVALEARLTSMISDTKNDILKWLFGMLLVQGGAAFTLIKLLPGH